jgi:hypothetical protein
MKFSGNVRMIGPIARMASRMTINRRMRGQLTRGDRRQETGDRRQETGDRKQDAGGRRQ